jgi:uncharacterized protein (TIGR03437 family)
LLFSSLLDWELGMTVDSTGNAYVAGITRKADFTKLLIDGYPTTSVLALRVDGSVDGTVTIEEPQNAADLIGWGKRRLQPIAPGALLSLTGTGLGPDQPVGAQIVADGVVANTLAGTAVYFDDMPAPLISVQAGDVACVVPFDVIGLNTVSLQLKRNGERSNAILLPVQEASPELLTLINQNGPTNSADNPASAGSIITAYVAGLGQTAPPSIDGQLNTGELKRVNGTPSIVVNGEWPADVQWIGPAPGSVAGIFQINFKVPQIPSAPWPLAIGLGSLSAGGSFDFATLYVK